MINVFYLYTSARMFLQFTVLFFIFIFIFSLVPVLLFLIVLLYRLSI